ncbi:hypothetical protein IEQ34_000649 [Dendrobium chrysotoxum]|uniref:TCTP domain-containing protein n=1 Tax=Dendrobium chrysotoxum TaxID=161865 RepID=A0AAV7HP32_DENCH|nr:hypothetical protein IEQ34_000649 [Dendrobium chrysotoxum]
MENLECKRSAFRIKNCAFDLLSLGDDLIDVDDDDFWWEFIGRDLRLKSPFLHCDINHVLSYYRDEQKRNLTDLANRLCHYMEEGVNLPKLNTCEFLGNIYMSISHAKKLSSPKKFIESTMLVYQDILSGYELLSDSLPAT